MALQKLENWQLRKANVLNDRTDLPDALKYQRKRWKPPGTGQAFQHKARDKGVQLLDRKQKAAEKRRAALEDDNTGTVQVSTVMIKNGDCKYKTFAKRWRDVPVKDEILCPPRGRKTNASQRLLDGHIVDMRFGSLKDTHKLRGIMRKTFSGKTLRDPRLTVKESKTKLKHSPYIQYTCMLDDEISELLNEKLHHETTFNAFERTIGGLNPTAFSRKSSKFYIGKKKGKKKSKSTRQISKLRHALAIKNYPDEDEQDFNIVEKYHNVFQAITQSTKTLVNCDRATLWLADYEHADGPTLWSKIDNPKLDDETITISCRLREGVVGECVSAEKVLNIPDAYKYPLFNPKVDRRTGYKTHSILCVPIRGKRKHEVLGAIQLINHFVVEKEPIFREDGTVEKEIEKRHFIPFDEKQETLVSLIIQCCRNEILKYYNRNINGDLRAFADEAKLTDTVADIIFHLQFICKNITLHALKSNCQDIIRAAKKKKLHEVSGRKSRVNVETVGLGLELNEGKA
eukprot:g13529.t1